MKLSNQILMQPLFRMCLEQNRHCEKGRKYCKHGKTHLLDTARIAYILNLERGLGLSQDLIYATALLHDCGRFRQYTEKIPHEIAGAALAAEILDACDCDAGTKAQILTAIREHRSTMHSDSLSALLYEADKRSRLCCLCKAESDCDWSAEKKNKELLY